MRLIRLVPDLLTWFRLVLIPPTAFLIIQERFGEALLLFFVAGASDAADGYIARRYDACSRLGSILDPLADKLLVGTCSVTLSVVGLLPWWLTGAFLARDAAIVIGAASWFRRSGGAAMRPTILGKVNTFLQIGLILAVTADAGGYLPLGPLLRPMFYLAMLSLAVSALDYARLWRSLGRNDG